jgi:ATP-dependent DNA helicase RecQ
VPIAAQPHKYFAFDLEEFCTRFKLRPTEAIHALKLLEREGLWTLTDAVYRPATVQFLADRHTLDSLQNFHPKLAYVSVGLLRMYSSIFHFPTRISETAVARQLRIPRDEVMQALSRMVAMGVLEYNKPGDGPQLFFHHYRVDSSHLLINMRRIQMLRKRHEERTAAMIAYLQNTAVCRERLLLLYFGEAADTDCGHCDVCATHQHQHIPLAALKKELITFIKQNTPIAPDALLGAFPVADRDTVLQLTRKWTDEGHLYYDGTMLHVRQ